MAAETPAGPLIVLVGAPGSGKSTWAARHFPKQDIVSLDDLRGVVCGDPGNQDATEPAVTMLHTVVAWRMKHGVRTVVDATNAVANDRYRLTELAAYYNRYRYAVIFNVPAGVCLIRNQARESNRFVPPEFLMRAHDQIADDLPVEHTRNPHRFCAGVWIGHDGAPDRVGGQIEPRHRGGTWLLGACKTDPVGGKRIPPEQGVFHTAGAALRSTTAAT